MVTMIKQTEIHQKIIELDKNPEKQSRLKQGDDDKSKQTFVTN